MKSFKDAVSQYTKRGSSGMLLTKPGYVGSVYKPKWSSRGEPKAETHVRFTGPVTEDGKNFQSWRYGPGDNEFGHWLVCVPVFKGGTTETFSFIGALEDPNNPGELLDVTDPVNPSPAYEFQTHASRMANNDPALKNVLLVGGKGRSPALGRRLDGCALAQGVLLLHGINNYYKRPQMPILFQMSQGASNALQGVLNKKVEGYVGDPLDLKNRFASGDILDVNEGRIFSFYNALADTAAPEETSVNWDKAGAASNQQASKEFEHYACELKTKLPIPRDGNGQIMAPAGKTLFTPWKDVIRFLTVEEQVSTLCRAYADLPVLLRDCLRQFSDCLPPFVTGRTTVGVNGTRPQAATYAPTAQAAARPQYQQPAAPAADVADVDWANAGEPVGDSGAELKAAMDMGLAGSQAGQATAPQTTNPATSDSRVNAAKARLANLQASVK